MAERMFLRTLTMIKRYVVLVLSLSLLTGCAASHILPEDPETFIPDRSSEVTVGQMERAAVRSVLGVPQFSSAYWGFDLFRTDTEQDRGSIRDNTVAGTLLGRSKTSCSATRWSHMTRMVVPAQWRAGFFASVLSGAESLRSRTIFRRCTFGLEN